jgi:hypothetical protein
MSDIYLELRSRIPVVAAKTHVGTARIQEAQDAVGLSNEAIARSIPISEKTWRRWKEAGQIPTAVLPAVARVLGLELRQAEVPPLDSHAIAGADDIAQLRRENAETQERLGRIEKLLAQLVGEQQGTPQSAR